MPLYRLFIRLRCQLVLWLIRRDWKKRYAVANFVCPDTATLVNAAKWYKRPGIPLPAVSHIFYHQASVELECAYHSLRTLLWNISEEDEVILYDKGGTLPASCFDLLARQRWRSWAVHQEFKPEMASYTYGMNHSIPMAQAPIVAIWRSDYVYPKGIYQRYIELIENHDIVLPYSIFIGAPHVRADFIANNWDKLSSYDIDFWRKNSTCEYSLYESQDPVHFAVRKSAWLKLGGLNHRLWGYGWQFGEFAARLRTKLPKNRVRYFDHSPPVHQNHSSTLMTRSSNWNDQKAVEDRDGNERFRQFLGGADLFDAYVYRWHQGLKPLPKEDRQ